MNHCSFNQAAFPAKIMIKAITIKGDITKNSGKESIVCTSKINLREFQMRRNSMFRIR